jgi:hypothetical protein
MFSRWRRISVLSPVHEAGWGTSRQARLLPFGLGGRTSQIWDDNAMRNRIAQALLALTLVLGIAAATAQPADAHRRGGGVAAGVAIGTLLGLGIAGAYAGPRYYAGPGCYRGPRQCSWVGRSCWTNRFGEYVCRGGDYRCWRPTICD